MASDFTPFTPPGTLSSAIALNTGDPVVLQALEVKSLAAQWAAGLLSLASIFASTFDDSKIRDITNPAMGGTEQAIKLALQNFITGLATDLPPIIDALTEKIDAFAATVVPDIDLTNIVKVVTDALIEELGLLLTNLPIFYGMIKQIVNLALLDASYNILSSDQTLITNTVNAMIAEEQSVLEEKMFLFERQNKNTLVLKGQWMASGGNDTISRIEARKGRQFLEIFDKAETLREKLTVDAFERAFKRMSLKIEAGRLLPTNLLHVPTDIYNLFAELIRKKYPDASSFFGAIPDMINNTNQGFRELATLFQTDRLDTTKINVDVANVIAKLFETIVRGVVSTSEASAKLATSEAT